MDEDGSGTLSAAEIAMQVASLCLQSVETYSINWDTEFTTRMGHTCNSRAFVYSISVGQKQLFDIFADISLG